MVRKVSRKISNRKQKVERLIDRYGCKCYLCGKQLTKNQVTLDHLFPRSKGGSNKSRNLRIACESCNSAKSDKAPAVWSGMRISGYRK